MIKRAKSKLMYVPWDADALAGALFETEDLFQAQVLAKALAIKIVGDTRAGKLLQVKYLEENKVETRAQEKTLTDALMQEWMRPLIEAVSAEESYAPMAKYLES
jgi:hypothetical protein